MYPKHLKQNLAHNTMDHRIEITVLERKFREDNEGNVFKLNLKEWVGLHQIYDFEGMGELSQMEKHS